MNIYYYGFTFICHCLAPYFNKNTLSDIRRLLTEYDIAEELLIDIANAYLVSPGVWAGLENKGLETLLDDESREYFRTLHALNVERNTHFREELIEAVRVLNQAGISPLLFKGAGQLLQPVHQDIGSRFMSDLDILIPTERIPDASNALKRQGYREVDVDYATQMHHHCPPLVRPGAYGPIELHRRAFQNEICEILPTRMIWEEAQLHVIDDLHFYLPSPTHSMLILILHSQEFKGGYDPRLFNPKVLQDLAATCQKYPESIDWSVIRRTMKDSGLEYLASLLVLSAHRLMGMPIPAGIMPGPSARLLYLASTGAMNWPIVDRLSSDAIKFSTYLICRRYGCSRRWLPLTAYRLRYLMSRCKRNARY